MFDDLANLHATLSASGGEGRGEVVNQLCSKASSSGLRPPEQRDAISCALDLVPRYSLGGLDYTPEEEKDFINEFR